MRKSIYLLVFTLISLISFSCDDDNDGNNELNDDPKGTVQVTFTDVDPSAEGIATILFENKAIVNAKPSTIAPIEPDPNPGFGLFHIISNEHFGLYGTEGVAVHILDKVNGLGDIKSIPENSLNVYNPQWHILYQEKMGYIFRFKNNSDYTNVRLFIDKVIDSDNELEVVIKYQYPFIP